MGFLDFPGFEIALVYCINRNISIDHLAPHLDQSFRLLPEKEKARKADKSLSRMRG
jgi:hypothetical protein